MSEEKLSSPTCKTCWWFVSFRDDYFDPLEPDWCGFCSHPDNEMDRAGVGEGCVLHERARLEIL